MKKLSLFIFLVFLGCSEKTQHTEKSEKQENPKKTEEIKETEIKEEKVEEIKRILILEDVAVYMDTSKNLGLYQLDGIVFKGDTVTYTDINIKFFGYASKLTLGYENYLLNKDPEDLEDVRTYRKKVTSVLKESAYPLELLQALLIGRASPETIKEFPEAYEKSKGM